jgi:hypothetical protein
MADSKKWLKPPLPTQALSSPALHPDGKDETLPAVVPTISTKYDILPPRPGQSNDAASSTQLAQTYPIKSAASSGSDTAVQNSAAILVQVRAKLAAAKETRSPSAATPSYDPSVQVFNVTYLKTIKCDICKRKNGDFLYKCICDDKLQICSTCVESSNPRPAKGIIGAKDWSVHAKLKEAHASYKQSICPGREEDGSYERDGVKFVVLQGKRGGKKTLRKDTPNKGVTLTDRNTSVRHGTATHRVTKRDKTVVEIAKARLERGQSEELKNKVAAARARMSARNNAGGRADQFPVDDRERKAAVLHEDGNGEPDDDDSDSEAEAEDGEFKSMTQRDTDWEWDEIETAAAVEASIRDVACE